MTAFRNPDCKTVECCRYKTIVTHEIDYLVQTALTEKREGVLVGRLWEHATAEKGDRNIVAGAFQLRDVRGPLACRQCREARVADFMSRSRDRAVSIDLVGGLESRAHGKDHDLAH